MSNRGLIISCHIYMPVDHQQCCSRQHSTRYIKDVFLSHAIKAVGCQLPHEITLPRMVYSGWRLSQVFPVQTGKEGRGFLMSFHLSNKFSLICSFFHPSKIIFLSLQPTLTNALLSFLCFFVLISFSSAAFIISVYFHSLYPSTTGIICPGHSVP